MKIKLIKKKKTIFLSAFLFAGLVHGEQNNRSILDNLQKPASTEKNNQNNTSKLDIAPLTTAPAQDDTVLHFEPKKLSSSARPPKENVADKKLTFEKPKPPINIDPEDLKQIHKDQIIRFSFEEASLENLVRYMEELFEIKFFADDDIEPTPPGGSVLKGHKITFKTNAPLTRDEAWNLFLKFLDIAGLTVVPTERKKFYYITSITNANREVLITYFNSKSEDVPDNSAKVRYVFFVQNAPLATIQRVVTTFASTTAQINAYPDLNAIILVDKGTNIRSLMNIVKEFDKEVPESMSVLKLERADAQDVAKLYADLTAAENPQGVGKLFGGKNQPDALLFPSSTRVLAEPRTNSLILLGSPSSIKKIEEFIKKTIDKTLEQPYSPLYIYELQYTQADNMQRILSQAIQFGANTTAGQYGGVRNGDQYFRPMTITSDMDGNRLIIKAEEADYTKLKELIKKLDVLQPQVAIEVLIVDVETNDQKELGAQIRQKYPDQPINNVQFATSGLSSGSNFYAPVMPASGLPASLLGNLIALAQGQTAGATLLSFGSSFTGGVWGILRTLELFGKTDVISNPFLLTTNGYTAQVSLGSTRRIQVATSLSAGAAQQGYQNISANLTVTIKPQISTDGSIQMGINIQITDFASDVITNGNTFTKTVQTSAIVNDKEVLVLGGIIQSTTSVIMSKVPILGDIPILGWFFRNKQKIKSSSNLLIFISPHVILHNDKQGILEQNQKAATYTQKKTTLIKDIMTAGSAVNAHDGGKDPIGKMYFNEQQEETFGFLNNKTPHEYVFDYKRTNKPKKYKLAAENSSQLMAHEAQSNEPDGPKKSRHQKRKEKAQQKSAEQASAKDKA